MYPGRCATGISYFLTQPDQVTISLNSVELEVPIMVLSFIPVLCKDPYYKADFLSGNVCISLLSVGITLD